MRKNLFKGLLTMCALGAMLTACSNEGNEVPEVQKREKKTVFMKLELPATSRAVEAPLSGANLSATVNDLYVYFHDGNSVLKYVKATNAAGAPLTIANLMTGAKIEDVPVAATTVTVYGNIPAGVSLPTAGTMAALKALQLDITSQNVAANVMLSGDDKQLQTWHTGNAAVPYAPGIADGDKYAELEIAPAVARVEIEGLATSATSAVDGFDLKGIYLNNFFEKSNLGGTAVGAKIQYGAVPTKYAQGQGLYTAANASKLFDENTISATGNPKEVIPGAGQRWVYQVVPNDNDSDQNEQLQLIFKLNNLQAKPGTNVNFAAGDQFITIRGFKNNAGNIVKLEKGKIYTISKADFEFDESNLATVPNTNAVGVWLKVTVKPWTVVAVKPNL